MAYYPDERNHQHVQPEATQLLRKDNVDIAVKQSDIIEMQYRCAAITGILANINNEGMTIEHCLNEADEIVKAAIAKWHRS